MRWFKHHYLGVLALAPIFVLIGDAGLAADPSPPVGGGWLRTMTGMDADGIAAPLRAFAIVTILGVVPSVALLTTCFPRVVIVLSFIRRALGTQELPPNLVVMGLALLLTGAVMLPVWKEVYTKAYVPLVESKEVTVDEALVLAEAPLKKFMLGHVLRNDPKALRLFIEISRSSDNPATSVSSAQRLEDLSFFVVLPAFVVSEIKVAFQMGFLIYLPFVLIDLIVSAVLVSAGMFMLPPSLVSLPLKVLVFVLVDGWNLVVTQLAMSLQGVL